MAEAPARQATLRAVLITLGVVVLGLIGLYLLRNFAAALLLIFAGILFGIFLDGLTNLTMRWLYLPRWAALSGILLLLAAAIAAFCWLAGPQAARQLQQLGQQLPVAASALQNRLREFDWGRALLDSLPSLGTMQMSVSALLGSVTHAFSLTF